MNNSHYILKGGSFQNPNAIIKKGTIAEMSASIKQAILDESAEEVQSITGLRNVKRYPTSNIHIIKIRQDGRTYEYTLTPAWEY